MTVLKLNLVDKPDEKKSSIFRQPPDTQIPYFVGDGNVNYECGSCGFVLAKNVHENQVKNVIFECPKCKQYNEKR